MDDYEKAVAKIKALGTQLYQDSVAAFNAMIDSTSDSTRQFYDGQSTGYDHSKERVEALVAELEADLLLRDFGL